MRKQTAALLGCLAALCPACGRFRAQKVSEIQMQDTRHQDRLLAGFYELQGAWRWTSRVFAVSLDPPSSQAATYLELDCSVPEEVMPPGQTPTLIASVNGVDVGRQTFYRQGRYTFTRYVPVAALKRRPAEVQFELDKSTRDQTTSRQLGLIVVSVALKEYEQTGEYHDLQTWLTRQGMKEANAARVAQVSPARQLELQKLFESLPVWRNLKYQNIRIDKSPLDLWMIQQIVSEVRPEVIVETGTSTGALALYLANALNGLNLEQSRILTVDREVRHQEASAYPLWKKYVEFVPGDSTDGAVAARLAQRAQGRKVVVILGSDPTSDHVLAELRAYAPLVSRDSYIVVQNTEMDRYPLQSPTGAGPYTAVSRFLQEDVGKNFEQDASRDMMVLTHNPGGWLRRK